MRLTAVIADDHPGCLATLREILQSEPGLDIVAQCANGIAAEIAIAEFGPDIAVLDVDMPGMDGIAVAAGARNRGQGGTRFVLVTMHKDPFLMQRARDTGVQAYVLKENVVLELIPAIRCVLKGERFAGRLCSAFD